MSLQTWVCILCALEQTASFLSFLSNLRSDHLSSEIQNFLSADVMLSGHSQNADVLKIFYKITFRLCV
jgi:hypothetical protein